MFTKDTGTHLSRSAGLAAALCLTLAGSGPWAQSNPSARGFDAVPFKPTPLSNSGIALEGADVWARRSVHAALLFDLSVNNLALRDGTEKIGNLIPLRLDAHLMAAYQVHERIEVGVDLPLVVYQQSNFGLLEEQGFSQGVYSLARPCAQALKDGCGLADLRVVPRVVILDPETFPLGLALIPEVRIPIGDGQSFTGDLGFTLAPRLAAERAFGPVRVLANAGYRFRKAGQFLNLYVGNEFTLGAGAIYRADAFTKWLGAHVLPSSASGVITEASLIGEVHLATPTGAPFTFAQSDSLKTPLELLLGARARVAKHWGIALSVGRGVATESGYGRPDLRVMFGVRYEREFLDRDGDGIADDQDGCPDVAEDEDDFKDSDGCPEPDNDEDGVPDGQDSCPNAAGTKELEGCPDTDQDDVPDHIDACADKPGPPENDGCPFENPPFVILEKDRLRLRANVLFETGEARIQKQSFPILDEVATVMLAHPDVGPITVEGHTDDRGNASYNRDLSTRRARSVVDYLTRKNVEKKRLKSRGFGEDKPIATNDTPLGRARNRRVEFRIRGKDIEVDPGTPASPVLVPVPAPAPAEADKPK